MLSNDQVFKPCTKSCKPNMPIPVAKRYSTESTPFISSGRFTTIIIIVSAVQCLIRITLLIMAGCCECATAVQFNVTELLCLVGNKSDSSAKYYILHLCRHHALQLTICHAHLQAYTHVSLSNWAICHTVINNELADRYFHVGYLSWVIYLCSALCILKPKKPKKKKPKKPLKT